MVMSGLITTDFYKIQGNNETYKELVFAFFWVLHLQKKIKINLIEFKTFYTRKKHTQKLW